MAKIDVNSLDLDGILGIGRDRGRIPSAQGLPEDEADLADTALYLVKKLNKYHSNQYVLSVKSDGRVFKISASNGFSRGRHICKREDVPAKALVSMIHKMQPDVDSLEASMKKLADTYPEMATEATFDGIKHGVVRMHFYMRWHCNKLNEIFSESPAAYLINNELDVGLTITYKRPKIAFDENFEDDPNKRHAGRSFSFNIRSVRDMNGQSSVNCQSFGTNMFNELKDIYFWVDMLLDMPAIYEDFRQKLVR